MRVFSATVKAGVIVSEGIDELPEGSKVTVVVDDEGFFATSSEEEAELLAAIGEADEPIPDEDALRRRK
jgi:hypothetical protein